MALLHKVRSSAENTYRRKWTDTRLNALIKELYVLFPSASFALPELVQWKNVEHL